MATLVLYLTILLMLSGCTTKEFKLGWYDKCLPSTVTEIVRISPVVPKDKLKCTPIAKPGIITKQSEVADYIVDLTVARKECESNLIYVRDALIRFKDNNNSIKQ